jgi:hypothetical protein
MIAMLRRSLLRCSLFLAVLGLALTSVGARAQDNSGWGRKFKVPPPSSRIEVTILKADNGKPVENAAVIFHPIQGDRNKGSLEVKSNEDGKAVIDVIPVGDTVRLQVIANGFQTYGQDYKIDKAEMKMEVRLKRPGAQYSIYKDKDTSANSGGGSGSDKSAAPPKNAAPPASGDKGSNSGSQGDAKPDAQSNPDEAQSK